MSDAARVEQIVDRLLVLGVPVNAVEPVREWVRAQRALVTPSRTDRQPPASPSETKGGKSAVGPDGTKQPDLVTRHEET